MNCQGLGRSSPSHRGWSRPPLELARASCLATNVSYTNLTEHFRRISQFDELGAIVHWDQAVNMPPAAGARRAEAVAALARLQHDLVADPRLDDWLAAARKDEALSPWERANLEEMARLHVRATALPAALVESTTSACQLSEQAWRRYRAENDFDTYAPYLEQVVHGQREVAAALSDKLGLSPYDSLMDAYEPKMASAMIDEAFAPLREFLPTFIDEALEKQAAKEFIEPKGPFPIDRQRDLARRMMAAVGLDMGRARLDESHHPFCGGVPSDVRITNRYREDEFLSGLMGVLHEAGHGKYEQGLPQDYVDQPVGKARGMVVHESQSLLQEMQVSRGKAFTTFLATRIRDTFPEHVDRQPEAYSVENLHRLQTRVRRGFIRVDADEVTYPAHIMVRYDLERDLIAGRLQVRELPEAWNERMTTYLGLRTLGNDKNGCLQDVHWPAGAFGYFPLYTLGAMVAAQLFSAARARLPDLDDDLERGDLGPLDAWLRTNVWSRGSSLSVTEMLVEATGQPLDPHVFIDHLKTRYSG